MIRIIYDYNEYDHRENISIQDHSVDVLTMKIYRSLHRYIEDLLRETCNDVIEEALKR